MTRVRAVLLAAATVATVVLAASPVGAATLTDHGWWWRGQSGLLMELPPPPTVPADGLSVARAPDDDVAWSAIRFQLEDSETAPSLVLTVANELGGQVAAIDACLPTFMWRGGQAQRWDTRPQALCEDGAVAGTRSEEGATWTWDLATLTRDDGLVDVVLVPGVDAQAFQVDFEPPTGDALQTTLAPTGPEPAAPPPVEPPAEQGGDVAPPPPASTPAPMQPPPPVAVAPPAATVAPPQPQVAPQATAGGQGAQPGPAAVADAAAAPADDLGRPVGIFLLVAALLTVLQLRGVPSPATHGVGPFAAGTSTGKDVRGLGRFARSRTGRPPSLI